MIRANTLPPAYCKIIIECKASLLAAAMKSVGVVGGGIIGLATAQAILEDFKDVSVTVYSSEYTPDTTADVSAGWIYPYLTGEDEREEDLLKWTSITIEHLLKFVAEDTDVSKGVAPVSGYILWRKGPVQIPSCVEKCFIGGRIAKPEEFRKFTDNEYAGGVFFTTWSCDCTIYLPCVMKKLKAKGVRFVEEKILSLQDVAEKGHDIVVNSAGFQSKYLAKDPLMKPIRGQVIYVKAPWIKHFYVEMDSDSYILPKIGSTVVGGTHDDDASLEIDAQASKNMWSGACKLLPSLRGAVETGNHAGLRPGRSKIRIEAENAKTASGKEYVILHHYGHGGAGVTLHWGCAKEASSVLHRFLSQQPAKL